MANPENPTARVRAVIARTRLDVLPTTRRKTASIPNPDGMTGMKERIPNNNINQRNRATNKRNNENEKHARQPGDSGGV